MHNSWSKLPQLRLKLPQVQSKLLPIWWGSFQSRSPQAVNKSSSISLKFLPFVTINERSISWKFQLYTYYQPIFVAIWNFWLFHKSCKIWVWANFRGQFLENWILRSFQPLFSMKFTRKCARISQNYFLNFWNQKKYFLWNIEKVLKLKSLKIFQNLGPWNSRMGLF